MFSSYILSVIPLSFRYFTAFLSFLDAPLLVMNSASGVSTTTISSTIFSTTSFITELNKAVMTLKNYSITIHVFVAFKHVIM